MARHFLPDCAVGGAADATGGSAAGVARRPSRLAAGATEVASTELPDRGSPEVLHKAQAEQADQLMAYMVRVFGSLGKVCRAARVAANCCRCCLCYRASFRPAARGASCTLWNGAPEYHHSRSAAITSVCTMARVGTTVPTVSAFVLSRRRWRRCAERRRRSSYTCASSCCRHGRRHRWHSCVVMRCGPGFKQCFLNFNLATSLDQPLCDSPSCSLLRDDKAAVQAQEHRT